MKCLADAVPRYKYLIEAVSNMMRAFKSGEINSPYQTDDLPFEAL